MANDSSTGGYILPTTISPPIEDAELDKILQRIVVGITGVPGNLVRPRWQPTLPKQPEPNINWCAIGVTYAEVEHVTVINHVSAGQGSDLYVGQEVVTVLVTFYGPSSMTNAALFRDGLAIPQNNEMIKAVGLTMLDTSSIRTAPEMVNQQWIRRYDIELRMRRAVSRSYPILNILSAEVLPFTDNH